MGRRADREKLGLTERSAVDATVALEPHEQLAETYRRTFASGPGADVLDDLRRRFGTRRSFVPDSNVTAFHEGQRDVYLMILSYIDRDVNRAPKENED